MDTRVSVQNRGWYQAVSETIGSPQLQSAQLGEIWACIPDLAATPLPDAKWAKVARVVPVMEGPLAYAPAKTTPAAVLFEPMPADAAEARNALARFPAADRSVVVHEPTGQLVTQHTDQGVGVRVHFLLAEGEAPIDQLAIITQRAPEHRFYGAYWLIPALSTGEVLAPLAAWWALLFSLSMLARYHPDAWVAALDVNSSKIAVPLEDSLDLAQTAVPHLVLESLLRQPVRFGA